MFGYMAGRKIFTMNEYTPETFNNDTGEMTLQYLKG